MRNVAPRTTIHIILYTSGERMLYYDIDHLFLQII
jgi:hypothetical protein